MQKLELYSKDLLVTKKYITNYEYPSFIERAVLKQRYRRLSKDCMLLCDLLDLLKTDNIETLRTLSKLINDIIKDNSFSLPNELLETCKDVVEKVEKESELYIKQIELEEWYIDINKKRSKRGEA